VVADLVTTACSGDRRAAARLLTLVERGGEPADAVAEATHPLAAGAQVVGITGAPGSGKSTLTDGLAASLAGAGRRPAVLAVDPSSPLTGGAILGDRVRMEAAATAGAFIRSMATRGHAGGLALAVPGMIRVLDACGFDPVLVETVGVGQVEVDVASAADTVVVVVTAGWGDAVQANKAGLLEIADLFVVNKADRPGAHEARRDLELMLDLSEVTGQAVDRPAVMLTTATEGTGIDDLWSAIQAHHARLVTEGRLVGRRTRRHRAEVRSRLEHLLTEAVEDRIADLPALPDGVPGTVARRLAAELLGE
ncbi:uncharacterized protein METZ01_LOCUS44376, partial [marine metagenome]